MKIKKNTPDISNWEFDYMDEFVEMASNAVKKTATEAIKLAFEDEETHIYFPVEWYGCNSDGVGGRKVDDPLTVYLSVALYSEGNPPIYEFNLREALLSSITTCKDDGSFSEGLSLLSSALRGLADEIDLAIKHRKP